MTCFMIDCLILGMIMKAAWNYHVEFHQSSHDKACVLVDTCRELFI